MANNKGVEGKANFPKGAVTKTTGEATENGSLSRAGSRAGITQQVAEKSPGMLRRLRERLQPPRGARKDAVIAVIEMPEDVPEQVDIVEDAAKLVEAKVQIDAAKWSRRRDIPLAILAWSGVVILAIWLVGHITTTILLLIIAGLLAYALTPAVKLLQRIMPRFLAVIIVYLVFLGGIGGLVYLIIRTSIDQVSSLSNYLKFLLTPVKGHSLSPLKQFLLSLGISSSQITSFGNQIINSASGLAGDALPILSGVLSGALDIFLVAILSIYLLIDGGRATNWLRRNMPQRARGRVVFLLNTLQRVVGGYIRGQLLLCGLIGVLVGIGMAIIGVPYALLLGVLAFVLEFIPIIGVLVSGAICVLLALTKGWLIALIVLAYFVGVHIFEGDVVGPRIVGRAVGLHPIVSIAALIAGGELFGIWGALLASPIAGVLQALLVAIYTEWREMHPHEFQPAKDKVADEVEENVSNKPVDPEQKARLLS